MRELIGYMSDFFGVYDRLTSHGIPGVLLRLPRGAAPPRGCDAGLDAGALWERILSYAI